MGNSWEFSQIYPDLIWFDSQRIQRVPATAAPRLQLFRSMRLTQSFLGPLRRLRQGVDFKTFWQVDVLMLWYIYSGNLALLYVNMLLWKIMENHQCYL